MLDVNIKISTQTSSKRELVRERGWGTGPQMNEKFRAHFILRVTTKHSRKQQSLYKNLHPDFK